MKRCITTSTSEIQRITREHFEKLYSSELENLDEMDKFLDTCNQFKLNQEDINHIKSPITCNEIKAVIKNIPTKMSSQPNFTKPLKN
jgi:hypothetical protein